MRECRGIGSAPSIPECSLTFLKGSSAPDSVIHGTAKNDIHGTASNDVHGTVSNEIDGFVNEIVNADVHGTVEKDVPGAVKSDVHETVNDALGTVNNPSCVPVNHDTHGTVKRFSGAVNDSVRGSASMSGREDDDSGGKQGVEGGGRTHGAMETLETSGCRGSEEDDRAGEPVREGAKGISVDDAPECWEELDEISLLTPPVVPARETERDTSKRAEGCTRPSRSAAEELGALEGEGMEASTVERLEVGVFGCVYVCTVIWFWFHICCDHGWIRSGPVNVRINNKQQQQQQLYRVYTYVVRVFCDTWQPQQKTNLETHCISMEWKCAVRVSPCFILFSR